MSEEKKCENCKFFKEEGSVSNIPIATCDFIRDGVLRDARSFSCSDFQSKEEVSSSRHQENDKEDHIPDSGKKVSEFLNYLLQRFNDYEVPITMSAEEVRNYLIEFEKEYEGNKEIPMGCSKWKEYGQKYGYDKYFNIKWETPEEFKRRVESHPKPEEIYNKWKYCSFPTLGKWYQSS